MLCLWVCFPRLAPQTVYYVSQGIYSDSCTLLERILFCGNLYLQLFPKIVSIGEPIQPETSVHSRLPSPFTAVKNFSFFEIMSPRASSLFRGSNIVLTVQLTSSIRCLTLSASCPMKLCSESFKMLLTPRQCENVYLFQASTIIDGFIGGISWHTSR